MVVVTVEVVVEVVVEVDVEVVVEVDVDVVVGHAPSPGWQSLGPSHARPKYAGSITTA